jgi:tRNA A37 threonylcarbamoyladenosine biosynthesis protein TsaE
MIDPEKEFTGLEIKKLLLNNDILAVEWADRIINNIKEYSDDAIIIWIKIEYGKNENDRIISWGNL